MSHVEGLHHPTADHYQVVSVTRHLPHHHHLSQCEPGLSPTQARPAPAECPAHPHGHPLLSDQGQGEQLTVIIKNYLSRILFQLLRQDKITYSDSSSASAWDDSSQMTSTSCSPSPSSASSFSQESLSSEVVKSSSNKVGKCIVTNL